MERVHTRHKTGLLIWAPGQALGPLPSLWAHGLQGRLFCTKAVMPTQVLLGLRDPGFLRRGVLERSLCLPGLSC